MALYEVSSILSGVGNLISEFNIFNADNRDKLVSKITSQDSSYFKNLGKRVTNINKEAKKNILFYPVFFSDSIDYDSLTVVRNAVEGRSAVLTQLLLESYGMINVENNDTKGQIIAQMKKSMEMEDVDRLDEDVYLPAAFRKLKNEEYCTPFSDKDIVAEEANILDYFNSLEFIEEGGGPGGVANPHDAKVSSTLDGLFDELDDFRKRKDLIETEIRALERKIASPKNPISYINSVEYKNDLKQYATTLKDFTTAQTNINDTTQRYSNFYKKIENDIPFLSPDLQADIKTFERFSSEEKNEIESLLTAREKFYERAIRLTSSKDLEALKQEMEAKDKSAKDLEKMKAENSKALEKLKTDEKLRYEQELKLREIRSLGKMGNTAAEIQKKVMDADPTLLRVSLQYKTATHYGETSVTLSVKSTIHEVPSEEIREKLPLSKFDTSFLLRIAKLYTGEISFWKDFIFNLDKVKGYFIKRSAGKNKWYAKLKRLTDVNNMKSLTASGGRKMPTASLVISMEDVLSIARTTRGKLDFTDAKDARDLLDSLSLLNFIIVDSSQEKILWYDDLAEDFQTYGYAELSNQTKSLSQKDLVKAFAMFKK